MTYCLSLLCREGIVFLSDSRTSAGVDNITVHPKMHVFSRPGERVLCLLASGNLSITQSVLTLIEHDIHKHEHEGEGGSLLSQGTLYDTVRYVGEKLREVKRLDSDALHGSGLDFNAGFILGGQIGTQEPQIYQIYAEGNAIHASRESPFLQIGELKYGKPILDRGFGYETSLAEAVKFGILSLDSTAKSNLSVGTPFEIFCYVAGSLEVRYRTKLEESDAYLGMVRERWQSGLIDLVHGLPEMEFPA